MRVSCSIFQNFPSLTKNRGFPTEYVSAAKIWDRLGLGSLNMVWGDFVRVFQDIALNL